MGVERGNQNIARVGLVYKTENGGVYNAPKQIESSGWIDSVKSFLPKALVKLFFSKLWKAVQESFWPHVGKPGRCSARPLSPGTCFNLLLLHFLPGLGFNLLSHSFGGQTKRVVILSQP